MEVVPCTCWSATGSFCGFRRKEDLLRGNCNDDALYYCSAINQIAEDRGKCEQGDCVIGSTVGSDKCPSSQLPSKLKNENLY
jgi:hypothetical protein